MSDLDGERQWAAVVEATAIPALRRERDELREEVAMLRDEQSRVLRVLRAMAAREAAGKAPGVQGLIDALEVE